MSNHSLIKAITWAIDYTYFLAYIAFGGYLFGDIDFTYNAKSCLLLLAYMFTLSDLNILKDILYLTILPSTVVSPLKREPYFSFTPNLVWNHFTTRLFAYGNVALLTYLGFIYFPWKGDMLKFILIGHVESLVTSLIRDVLGMRLLHAWMHKKAYSLHKSHHASKINVNMMNVAYFDWFDLFLENGVGIVVFGTLKYVLFGSGMLWQGVMMQFHFDTVIHSVNPYTAAFLNPVLDWFCLANISHNLHHAVVNDYYPALPLNHIYDRKSAFSDIAKYNKLMGTNIY